MNKEYQNSGDTPTSSRSTPVGNQEPLPQKRSFGIFLPPSMQRTSHAHVSVAMPRGGNRKRLFRFRFALGLQGLNEKTVGLGFLPRCQPKVPEELRASEDLFFEEYNAFFGLFSARLQLPFLL